LLLNFNLNLSRRGGKKFTPPKLYSRQELEALPHFVMVVVAGWHARMLLTRMVTQGFQEFHAP
jgi:hypothetical protein